MIFENPVFQSETNQIKPEIIFLILFDFSVKITEMKCEFAHNLPKQRKKSIVSDTLFIIYNITFSTEVERGNRNYCHRGENLYFFDQSFQKILYYRSFLL